MRSQHVKVSGAQKRDGTAKSNYFFEKPMMQYLFKCGFLYSDMAFMEHAIHKLYTEFKHIQNDDYRAM